MIFFFSCLFLLNFAFICQAVTYYVSPNGTDANSGSVDFPWKTIQKAADTAIAGDIVLVQAGNYPERVFVKKSGANGTPIIFQAQGTVVTKGFALVNIITSPSYQMLPVSFINISGFEIANTDYVRWHGEKSAGVYIKGGNNIIENNYIHDCSLHGIGLYGVPGDSADTHDNVVRNNRLYHNGMVGININGRNNLVENNEIWETVQCHPNITAIEDVAADNNGQKCPFYPAVAGLDADGIRFFGKGHIIRKNYIHDIKFGPLGIDPSIGDYNDNPHIDCFQTWAGTYTELAQNILFEQNFCDLLQSQAQNENGHGFMLDGGTNNLIIRNNIIRAYGGINTGGTGGGADYLYIYNNIWINNLAFEQFWPFALGLGGGRHAIVKNNIFYNQPYHTVNVIGDTSNTEVDYNLAYNSDGSKPHCVNWGDFITCQPANHNLWNVNPQFVNPSIGDYHLLPNSPAVNAGFSLGSLVSNDYEGILRPQGAGFDIGAYEYSTLIPTLTGDLNADNTVNILDLVIVGSNFGKDYNDAGTDERADANGDKVINILDLVMVGSNFGKSR